MTGNTAGATVNFALWATGGTHTPTPPHDPPAASVTRTGTPIFAYFPKETRESRCRSFENYGCHYGTYTTTQHSTAQHICNTHSYVCPSSAGGVTVHCAALVQTHNTTQVHTHTHTHTQHTCEDQSSAGLSFSCISIRTPRCCCVISAMCDSHSRMILSSITSARACSSVAANSCLRI